MADPSVQYRMWWPLHLCSYPSIPSSMALVGYVNLSLTCIDVVVVTAHSFDEDPSMQVLLDRIKKMQTWTSETSENLCILGFWWDLHEKDTGFISEDEKDQECIPKRTAQVEILIRENFLLQKRSRRLDAEFSTQLKQNSNNLNLLLGGNYDYRLEFVVEMNRGAKHCHCFPSIHPVNASSSNVHVVIYKQPSFGNHHFSLHQTGFLSFRTSQPSRNEAMKKPNWVVELEQQKGHGNIEIVITQLNFAAFLEQKMHGLVSNQPTSAVFVGKKKGASYHYSVFFRFCFCTWSSFAAAIAALATLFYIFATYCLAILNSTHFLMARDMPVLLASQTLFICHSRFRELKSWLIVLTWGGNGHNHPNVSVAERLSTLKHSVWAKLVADIVIGATVGSLVLFYHRSVSACVLEMAYVLTNDILRTGCVWLMGVPAGFKLNNELARAIGTLSLNLVQAWSTLGIFIASFVDASICVIAVISMTLGATLALAVVVDISFLATIHVVAMYQVTAFIYANQLQSLAALWRLFSGRQKNPLRRRVESYDCSVEELVVASLMFTPLLLLLPTTSVFYIFFTIIHMSLCLPRFMVQILISILNSFPYSSVGMWLLKPGRFPSGIWFQNLLVPDCTNEYKSATSSLHVTEASLGELLSILLAELDVGISWAWIVIHLRNMVDGGRLPSYLTLGKHAKLPRNNINSWKFWKLCYDVLSASGSGLNP